jgi:DNA-binding response OmpR family regulator
MSSAAILELKGAEEVERLRNRVSELEARVEVLSKDMLGRDLPIWLAPMAPRQRDLLRLLMGRPRVTTEAAMVVLYGHLIDERGDSVIRVLMHNLRKRLAPHGVSIGIIKGEGWYLDAKNRAALSRVTPP